MSSSASASTSTSTSSSSASSNAYIDMTMDNSSSTADEQLIYWEKQESALCASHALNSLLQHPYYTEVDLAELAHELDRRVEGLMRESGVESSDYLAYQATDSQNVDESGNFSIEVLKNALANFSITIEPYTSPSETHVRENPVENGTAFICNLYNHWLTLRKIGGVWYNMNSLLPFGVEVISNTYLSIYLHQLLQEKYSIFVVHGILPESRYTKAQVDELQRHERSRGQWFTVQQAIANTKHVRPKQSSSRRNRRQQHSSGSGSDGEEDIYNEFTPQSLQNDDDELNAAIAASLGQQHNTNDMDMNHDEDNVNAAIQASLFASMTNDNNIRNTTDHSTSARQERQRISSVTSNEADLDDAELQAAIAMSMQEK